MEPKKTSFVAGLLLGMTVGLFVGGLFAALFTWQLGRKQSWDLRAGWNLVPVVVANQDMAEGEEVTFDKIAQRSAPEQFVTASVVKPDAANSIANQRLLVPVRAGDLLLWSQFETRPEKQVSGATTP